MVDIEMLFTEGGLSELVLLSQLIRLLFVGRGMGKCEQDIDSLQLGISLFIHTLAPFQHGTNFYFEYNKLQFMKRFLFGYDN